MAVVLQVNFPKDALFGDEMAAHSKEIAESIAEEPGMIWKIWLENEEEKEAGGLYLFETRELANAYLTMHTERLKAQGWDDIEAKIFDINRALTQITRGPVFDLD